MNPSQLSIFNIDLSEKIRPSYEGLDLYFRDANLLELIKSHEQAVAAYASGNYVDCYTHQMSVAQ